jgi:hypothetical protein
MKNAWISNDSVVQIKEGCAVQIKDGVSDFWMVVS